MPVQKEIMERFQDSGRTKTGRVKKTLGPKAISKLLRKIYQARARASELFFWAQHENRMQELEAAECNNKEKPQNFGELSSWPPKTATELLACSIFGGTCIECACKDTKILQEEVYMNWSVEMNNFRLDDIRRCSISAVKGYELRARNVVFVNRCIG
jgi:hypothetical protein